MTGYGQSVGSGRGFESIQAEPTAKGAVVKVGVQAPWVVLMEEGVKSHWVSPYTIQQHLESPGSTFMKKAPKGQYGGDPIWWHWRGPFVAPALASFKPEILDESPINHLITKMTNSTTITPITIFFTLIMLNILYC